MTAIGIEALQAKGWWGTHRWLLLRRTLRALSVTPLKPTPRFYMRSHMPLSVS